MTSLLLNHLCQVPQHKLRKKCLKGWSNVVPTFFFRLPGWKSLCSICWTLEQSHPWHRFDEPVGNRGEPIYASVWFCRCPALYLRQKGLANGPLGRLLGTQQICNYKVCFRLRFFFKCASGCACKCEYNTGVQVFAEARRVHRLYWSWRYRQLEPHMMGSGNWLKPSPRAVCVLYPIVIAPAI